MENNNVLKEMIVKCPYSGNDINIAPLLYTFGFFEGPSDIAERLNQLLEDMVVFANQDMMGVLTDEDNRPFYVLTSLRRSLACTEPGKYTPGDLSLVFGR